MVGGQVDDLTQDGKIPGRLGSGTLADLESIHSRKTGAMFLASLRLGLLTAQGEKGSGPDKNIGRALETYGRWFRHRVSDHGRLVGCGRRSSRNREARRQDSAKGS